MSHHANDGRHTQTRCCEPIPTRPHGMLAIIEFEKGGAIRGSALVCVCVRLCACSRRAVDEQPGRLIRYSVRKRQRRNEHLNLEWWATLCECKWYGTMMARWLCACFVYTSSYDVVGTSYSYFGTFAVGSIGRQSIWSSCASHAIVHIIV